MSTVERAEQAAPYPPGTRVFHRGQTWAHSLPSGTGEVIRVEGPDVYGDFEYLVRTSEDFARRPGPGNPETRETWWSSRHVRRAAALICPDHHVPLESDDTQEQP